MRAPFGITRALHSVNGRNGYSRLTAIEERWSGAQQGARGAMPPSRGCFSAIELLSASALRQRVRAGLVAGEAGDQQADANRHHTHDGDGER